MSEIKTVLDQFQTRYFIIEISVYDDSATLKYRIDAYRKEDLLPKKIPFKSIEEHIYIKEITLEKEREIILKMLDAIYKVLMK